jgi:SRSO17 transposase
MAKIGTGSTWREGTKGNMTSRFAAVRIRVTKKCRGRSGVWPEEWALIEWPDGKESPEKYHLSSLPENTPLQELVNIVKTRWRIEHDYRELKDELGLDHYEGRGWRGFHHHGIACIAAFSFVIAERARLSPPRVVAFLRAAPLPKSFRPRGSPIEITAT